MAYPTSLDELTDGVPSDVDAPSTAMNDATYPHDDHHRALGVAVEAIEAELGTLPKGGAADVKTRIANTETVANAAVPKSTVTTAGDLIVGTGNAAVSRLGIGSALQVLRTNAGATALEWATASSAAPMGRLGTGTRYGNPGFVTCLGNTDVAYAANRVYYFPAYLLSAASVDAFTFYCTSAPGGTVLARVGFVAADTDWQPTGTVTDCGTVSVSAFGNKIGTFSAATMPAGRVLCILETDATGCTVRQWPGNPACGSLQGDLGAAGPYGNVYATGIANNAPALTGTHWTAITGVSGGRPFLDMPMQWRLA